MGDIRQRSPTARQSCLKLNTATMKIVLGHLGKRDRDCGAIRPAHGNYYRAAVKVVVTLSV